MSLLQLATAVYPYLRSLCHLLVDMPLSHRSVMIKCCQAQCIPTDPDSTLYSMVHSLPDFATTAESRSYYSGYRFSSMSAFSYFSDFMDPVHAAIILDLCRYLPVRVPLVYNFTVVKDIPQKFYF